MSDVEDVEEELNTPFKRRVTLAVTVVALLAGILGLGASDAGARESQTARDAAIAAVVALSSQNEVAANSYEQFGNYVNALMLRRSHDMDIVGAQLLGQDTAVGTPGDWQAASDTVTDLTPLLQPGRLADRPDLLWNDLLARPNLDQLRQAAIQETASSWGDKSNLYVGGVTLLAIAVTLLGLSLTVGVRIRRVFIWPAAVLTVVTVIAASIVAIVPPAGTPPEAVQAVADGDRLAASRDFEGALAAYDRAIELDGDYATAYSHRAVAHLLAGSPERETSMYVVSTTSRTARLAAIADYNQALDLGGEDYMVLVNQGANYFHLADYEHTESYSRRAIEVNPDLPLPWLNLGLALASQGRDTEARDTYAHAIELIDARPTRQERRELYSAARGTLVTASIQAPGHAKLVDTLLADLVRAEGTALIPDAVDAPDAAASELKLTVQTSVLRAQVDYRGIPTGAPVAWVVYYRSGNDQEWVQRADLTAYDAWNLAESGTATRDIFDFSCPTTGYYRVDLYAGGRRLASQTVSHPGTSLQLSAYADNVGGFNLCRPDGWELGDTLTGSVTVSSADGRATLRVRTVPVLRPPSGVDGREALAQAVLDRLQAELPVAAGAGEARHTYLFGQDGPARDLTLDDGRGGYIWASVGVDGVVRTVSATFPYSRRGDINELIPRVVFY